MRQREFESRRETQFAIADFENRRRKPPAEEWSQFVEAGNTVR